MSLTDSSSQYRYISIPKSHKKCEKKNEGGEKTETGSAKDIEKSKER
jgi:hypothetical protein